MHNYYDVLNVAPGASAEVIRAAYRALSQKYHPDRNPHNPQAHQRMAEINEAYNVLSDPEKRHHHDVWIARQSLQAHVSPALLARKQTPFAPPVLLPNHQDHVVDLHDHGHGWMWIVGIAILIAMSGVWWRLAYPPAENTPAQNGAPVLTAPNGQLFPLKAAYVSGYPVLRERGNNTIIVHASSLQSPVFAQLYELHAGKFTAIRSFYIPAGETFALHKIGDGDFSLQYQRINDGKWAVSDGIEIKNTEISRKYQDIDIRL
ncbi:J domain-containing protein [Snodgrassella sp. B3800]|uniref:J domain-containing protein n=1 Tax=Snodgrassella sp. B3800 TaxID=2818039 RepID=UPI00226A09D9|nr:J domain-containing protein [Snodgrassella sp. B3800]MCX8746578.1 J domain-containing protein [Snodgrassella sp. B3800]